MGSDVRRKKKKKEIEEASSSYFPSSSSAQVTRTKSGKVCGWKMDGKFRDFS